MKTTEGQRAEWKRRAEIVDYPERCDTLPLFAFVLLDLIDEIDKLQADRKALLEALHAFVDQTLVLPSGESVWGEELINARAAITQAEKEG